MNTQLIPVFAGHIQNQSVQLVDARLLHSFLEVTRDFSTWIKNRIDEYEFIENIDFLLHKFGEQKGRGGHNKIDYHLTLDMAKELSMVERNEKGKIARRYFIECEQRLIEATVTGQNVITLEDIERLIDQRLKLIGQTQEPPQQKAPGKPGAYHYNVCANYPNEVRWVSDIDINQMNRQLEPQGFRVVKI